MVRPTGFEPAAYRVGVCHSIQLSYGRIFGFGRRAVNRVSIATFPTSVKLKFSSKIVKKIDNFSFILYNRDNL